MAQKIAAPAETLRRLAGAATREAVNQERAGRPGNADRCRRAAEAAYDAAEGKSASLVSMDADLASALCAFGRGPEVSDYANGLRQMLIHQHYWQG